MSMKLRTKILLAFGSCLLIMLFQALTTGWFIRDLQSVVQTMVVAVEARKTTYSANEQIATAQPLVSRLEEGDTNAENIDALLVYLRDLRAQMARLETLNVALLMPPEATRGFRSALGEFDQRAAGVEALSANTDADKAMELAIFLGEAAANLREELSKLGVEYGKKLDAAVAHEQKNHNRPIQAAIGTMLAAAVLITLFALFASTWLVRHIGRLAARLSGIAEGDLRGCGRIFARNDELGQLDARLHEVTSHLAGVIGDIRQTSASIANTAHEISQGNADLSQRTESQATLLMQTTRRMEELTQTVRQNAGNAGNAAQMAKKARARAESGGELVTRAIKAMDEINAASARISEIIATIDGIAFQTNLLALNAAVEAARAGEQGRGFAVVASEVRNLAQRSAEASREVKKLVGDAVARAQDGTGVVRESGDVLAQIVAEVQKVAGVVNEIAAASTHQSEGIGEINDVIRQLEAVTQQNAALVEEAAAASEAFLDQTRHLDERMGFFNTGQDNHLTP